MTAIEFGVADGDGLPPPGRLAAEVTAHTGFAIYVVGFDTGESLSNPRDYRDRRDVSGRRRNVRSRNVSARSEIRLDQLEGS
jgi:hypothetical protein